MNPKTIERFWHKVRKGRGCWEWTGSKRHKGYGAFVWCLRGDIVQGRAHRFSWELHYGLIPKGLCVLHHCDNPACVRPNHLFLGTKADNNKDMFRKKRNVAGGTYSRKGYERGEAHHAAKLNTDKIKQMRRDRAAGAPYSSLATKYRISISVAWRICHREAWAHVV